MNRVVRHSCGEEFRTLCELLEVACHGIFEEIVEGSPSFRSQLLNTRFGFGPEINFHKLSPGKQQDLCQSRSDLSNLPRAAGPSLRWDDRLLKNMVTR